MHSSPSFEGGLIRAGMENRPSLFWGYTREKNAIFEKSLAGLCEIGQKEPQIWTTLGGPLGLTFNF